jgi:alkyldihydroxyacetonephosphate synthase
MRISTGGMMPPESDAVVMVEYTDETDAGLVEVHRGVSPWQNVIQIGDDIRKGDLVFSRGRRLRAHDLGALTGIGVASLRVFKKPIVALISTGDEIVDVTAEPAPGQVRNINQHSLAGLIDLDERSGLATFGAGRIGPALEAARAPNGLTLGHFPQSFARSTLGGWVAARSAGQQSIGFGRIEDLFGGGRVVAPAGALDLPSHPASAAGPDLRELVLGSEGRLGVITRATVRAVPKPQREAFPAWFLPDWPHAMEASRELARAGLPLSMVRVSTPHETISLLALAGRSRSGDLLARYLRLRGLGPERSLVLVGASGMERFVEGAVREAGSILRRHGGIAVGGSIGRRWLATRFAAPDLRDTAWDAGYALDTIETAVDWTRLPDLAASLGRVLRHGLDDRGERVHAFSHLSHLYPNGSSIYATYVFRRAADPDETLERWRRLKAAASAAIVAAGGTISHQHGVGRDHLPYLPAEKGELGMAALADVARRFDPDGIMNPGVLLEDRR